MFSTPTGYQSASTGLKCWILIGHLLIEGFTFVSVFTWNYSSRRLCKYISEDPRTRSATVAVLSQKWEEFSSSIKMEPGWRGGKKQPKIKAFKPNEITGNLTAQSSHQPHSMQLNVTTDFRIGERKGMSQSEMWSAALMTKKRSL